ncbi:MAG TPA: hypothetical protein VMV17_12115 [Streptosporangiaceae bacterium]|nr:hypothetical protein [Streptosporangiaceae bacterium]
MSFTDRLVLWLHVAFVIFTIGPVTMAIMSSPRAIRTRNAAVLRHLLVMTRIFGAASLAVLVFGIILGQSLHDLGKAWLTASMTLYVVALVLLVLIMRDQRRAIAALAAAGGQPAVTPAPDAAEEGGTGAADADPDQAAQAGSGGVAAAHVASVERGRIASMGGVVSLLWLAILVLMVWQP